MSTRQISRLLIANRGEIARRIQRTAHEMGISTIAIYSDDDRDAAFVNDADIAVPLHGRTAAQTYLDADKVLHAARRCGADAIHPGYGFLSENANFARACAEAGIIFVGPSPDVLHTMGLKDVAKTTATAAGLPTLPDTALDEDPSTWTAAADTVGYPLLVKATAGGGGKGMRLVTDRADLDSAVSSARREAASSFNDRAVFLERFLPRARHIEVQVFGDEFGNALHLYERECSVQRRHQKVIEESPAPKLSPELRDAMTSASVGLVATLGYVGAGTIEYLVDQDSQSFYFLEMNTRLQVEHGVTEAVTGLDLVRLQLHVAAGLELPVDQADVRQTGHAIEARLCAEDPGDGYRPTSGVVHHYQHEQIVGVRYDDAFDSEGVVPPFFDSMIAKIIGFAATRGEAIGRLARALRELRIHGVGTNRDHLVTILEDSTFVTADVWTGYLDANPGIAQQELVDPNLHLAALTAGASAVRYAAAPAGDVPPGWRALPGSPPAQSGWRNLRTSAVFDVRYQWRSRGGDAEPAVMTFYDESGESRDVEIHPLEGGTIALVDSGIRYTGQVSRYADGTWWVNIAGTQSGWRQTPRLPNPESSTDSGGGVVEVPGTVVCIDVTEGDEIEAGQRLIVVEAMKMEYPVLAEHAGVVDKVTVRVGDFISPPTVPVVLTEPAR